MHYQLHEQSFAGVTCEDKVYLIAFVLRLGAGRQRTISCHATKYVTSKVQNLGVSRCILPLSYMRKVMICMITRQSINSLFAPVRFAWAINVNHVGSEAGGKPLEALAQKSDESTKK